MLDREPPTFSTATGPGPVVDLSSGSLPTRTGRVRCDGCEALLARDVLARNGNVCPRCDHHHPLSAAERVVQVVDRDSFEERCGDLRPCDPLLFVDRLPYQERLESEQARTGSADAAVAGVGRIEGRRVVLGLTDSRFLMGSMGSVVGEKLVRAVELATVERVPPGARVVVERRPRFHEGIFSLMQLAKVSAAPRGTTRPAASSSAF